MSCALLFIPVASGAENVPEKIIGKVIYVDDGDTLTLMVAPDNKRIIRLTDVDAPETGKPAYGKLGQPFSQVAKANLQHLVGGKTVEAHCYERDRYGRIVCRVFTDGLDVSLEQIRAGLGWTNTVAGKKFVRDDKAYALETEAKEKRKGLWSQPNPVPPWEWRRACWQNQQCPNAGP